MTKGKGYTNEEVMEYGAKRFNDGQKEATARIMAIIEAKKKMYSESNGLVYVLDIILKEIESKK